MEEFADISSESDSKFKSVRFLKLIPGYPVTIRVLDHKAYKVHKHYLPKIKASVVCLGKEFCPICQNNKLLYDNAPEGTDYRDVKGILARQTRYLVNVLNRTVAKVTSAGKVIYAGYDGTYPTQDPETGEILTGIEAQPLNTIEVLERGKKLFGKFNIKHQKILDPETKKPKGLWNFDLTLVAEGQGRDMDIDVEAHPERDDELDIQPEHLFVLETVPLQLTPDELRRALAGTSLSDIFAERRAVRAAEEGKPTANDDEVKRDEIEVDIDDLFDLDMDDEEE